MSAGDAAALSVLTSHVTPYAASNIGTDDRCFCSNLGVVRPGIHLAFEDLTMKCFRMLLLLATMFPAAATAQTADPAAPPAPPAEADPDVDCPSGLGQGDFEVSLLEAHTGVDQRQMAVFG